MQELILAWLLSHFHLVYWMRQDSNSQLLDRESSLLTTRLDQCPSSNQVYVGNGTTLTIKQHQKQQQTKDYRDSLNGHQLAFQIL
jgi:hypothetical protein